MLTTKFRVTIHIEGNHVRYHTNNVMVPNLRHRINDVSSLNTINNTNKDVTLHFTKNRRKATNNDLY